MFYVSFAGLGLERVGLGLEGAGLVLRLGLATAGLDYNTGILRIV